MARFVTRLLFILALGATLPSAAQMLPQVVTRELPNLTLRGDGVMRFFGLKVYDVRLWSAMRAFTHTDPFALELVYDMSFSGRDIAERSVQEMRGQGHVIRAQKCALLLEGEIAPLVGSGGPDQRHIRAQGTQVKPLLAVELHHLHNLLHRAPVHAPALASGIDKGVQPHLGQHTGPLGRALAQLVKDQPAGQVVGFDFVVVDHLPDAGRFQGRGAAGVGTGDNPAQQTGPGDVVDALDAVHIPRCDGVDCGQVAGRARGGKTFAHGTQQRVRYQPTFGQAQQAGGGSVVGQFHRVGRCVHRSSFGNHGISIGVLRW